MKKLDIQVLKDLLQDVKDGLVDIESVEIEFGTDDTIKTNYCYYLLFDEVEEQ